MRAYQCTIAVALLLVGFVRAHSAIATPVTWTLTETSCTSTNGGCNAFGLPLELPLAIATLTLPNINTTGSYDLGGSSGGINISSSDNFSLSWLNARDDVPVTDTTRACVLECTVNITFTSSLLGLSISIFENLFDMDFIKLSGKNLGTSGIYGSDADMPGCGLFASCLITGVWNVPEPSSVAVLATALLLILKLSPARMSAKAGCAGLHLVFPPARRVLECVHQIEMSSLLPFRNVTVLWRAAGWRARSRPRKPAS
jgi:hypothetical protein